MALWGDGEDKWQINPGYLAAMVRFTCIETKSFYYVSLGVSTITTL